MDEQKYTLYMQYATEKHNKLLKLVHISRFVIGVYYHICN